MICSPALKPWGLVKEIELLSTSTAVGTMEILGVSTIVIFPDIGDKSIVPVVSCQLLLLVIARVGCPLKAITLPAPVLTIWPVMVILPPLLLMS